MTEALKSYAYPGVSARDRLIVDNLPFRRWVECASCIDAKDVGSAQEAEQWAKDHHRTNSAHDRFRVVRQTGWKFVPTSDDVPTTSP
ncbi:hypothetical protein [Streptomyces bobili]|uniref:DUF7848 domain-containing protein n=1 Tax=Streptomyces bobili TaxID=67280 RepID=UPI000A3876D0|nr:hypothetical protein [Streptomyces bobili]